MLDKNVSTWVSSSNFIRRYFWVSYSFTVWAKKKQIVKNRTHHHHHHIALVARISLTLSRHSSLSFIALGRSSGQHPVSSHSCWMYVRAGHPAFAWPCVGIHKSTSLMSSSLLLQQCPACLVRLTWIVFVMGAGGRSLNLIIKVPLVLVKSHNFLKENSQKYPKIGNWLEFFFLGLVS